MDATAGEATAGDATAGRVEILQQAQRLRELAGRDVRELGRDLLGPTAQLPAAAVHTPTVRSVLRRALQGSRIRGGLTLSISLLMSISLAIAWGGPWAGLALTAATLVAMAWLAFVEHALLRRKAPSWAVTAGSWAIAMVLYASILSTAYPARGLQLSVLTIGGWCLAYLTLALVDGLIDMNRARTIELAQREAEVRQASQRTWQQAQSERGRLGRLLHGPVQGRLAATSLALRAYEQGQGGISLEDCAGQLERTLAALVELDAEPAPANLDLDLALAQVRADWAGLMNVTFEVTGGDLVGTQFDGEPIMQAAIECLSNAARHAGARHAHVLIKATDEGVWLTVRDDGSGPAEAVRDGIRDGMRDGAGWAGIRATGASVRLHRNSEATLVRAWWPSEVISPPARRSAPPPAHLEPAAAPAGLAP